MSAYKALIRFIIRTPIPHPPMPPRIHRLTKDEIEVVVKTGRFLNVPVLTALGASCKVLHRTDSFKIAITVSKKVAPHAVDRNKLRRRWYNALYQSYKAAKTEKGPVGWYMIQLRPGALSYLTKIPNDLSLPHVFL